MPAARISAAKNFAEIAAANRIVVPRFVNVPVTFAILAPTFVFTEPKIMFLSFTIANVELTFWFAAPTFAFEDAAFFNVSFKSRLKLNVPATRRRFYLV